MQCCKGDGGLRLLCVGELSLLGLDGKCCLWLHFRQKCVHNELAEHHHWHLYSVILNVKTIKMKIFLRFGRNIAYHKAL
jgi:hypothetical protein